MSNFLMNKQAVINAIANTIVNGESLGYGLAEEIVSEIPSVKPKIGHWAEENINGLGRKIFCSECGCSVPFEHVSTGDVYSSSGHGVINKTKYCPNCGAEMKGGE